MPNFAILPNAAFRRASVQKHAPPAASRNSTERLREWLPGCFTAGKVAEEPRAVRWDSQSSHGSHADCRIHVALHCSDDLARLEAQVQKLRASVARRRSVPGACPQTDDVLAITSHYERLIASLEEQMAEVRARDL